MLYSYYKALTFVIILCKLWPYYTVKSTISYTVIIEHLAFFINSVKIIAILYSVE